MPALTSLLSGQYPATELMSTVNLTVAPSLLSLPCRALLNWQPSTKWVPGWRSFHTNHLVFSSQAFSWTTDSPTTSLHFTQLPQPESKSKSKLFYDWRSVGQSVLVSGTHLGLTTRFVLLSDSCGFVHMGRSLWRENGSAVYNCCWSSPAQSFLGPSPTGLVTIFRPGVLAL
jgi:hypothetical protein